MPVTDLQTESLEAFLDGELSEQQAATIRRLIDSEPAVAAALAELEAERRARGAFYSALERHDSNEDQVVGRLLAGVEHALDQEERRALVRSDRRRVLRYISGAAACVIFSFFAGWVGHSRVSIRGLSIPSNGIADRTQQGDPGNGIGTLVSNTYLPKGDAPAGFSPDDHSSGSYSSGSDSFGNYASVGYAANHFDSNKFASDSAASPAPRGDRPAGGVDVALTDTQGHVIAVQHFNSLQEARDFTADVGRWQQQIKEQQMRQQQGPVGAKEQF